MTLEQFITYLQGLLERREVPENTKVFFVDIHKPGESMQDLAVTIDENGLSIYNTIYEEGNRRSLQKGFGGFCNEKL